MEELQPTALELVTESLKRHEGFVGHLYDDKTGSRIGRLPSGGWPTCGYGFNLAAWPLTKDEADYILRSRIFTITTQLSQRFFYFANLSPRRQAVLIDMAYNMGVDGVMNFKKMLYALRRMDYATASAEIVNSAAGRDPRTAKRYERLAGWMLNG